MHVSSVRRPLCRPHQHCTCGGTQRMAVCPVGPQAEVSHAHMLNIRNAGACCSCPAAGSLIVHTVEGLYSNGVYIEGVCHRGPVLHPFPRPSDGHVPHHACTLPPSITPRILDRVIDMLHTTHAPCPLLLPVSNPLKQHAPCQCWCSML